MSGEQKDAPSVTLSVVQVIMGCHVLDVLIWETKGSAAECERCVVQVAPDTMGRTGEGIVHRFSVV